MSEELKKQLSNSKIKRVNKKSMKMERNSIKKPWKKKLLLMVMIKKLHKVKIKKKAKRTARKRLSLKKRVREARNTFTNLKMVNPCNIRLNRNLKMKRRLSKLQKMMRQLWMTSMEIKPIIIRKMGMITMTKRKKA